MELFAAIGAILVVSHVTKPSPKSVAPVMEERTLQMVKRDHPMGRPVFTGVGWNKDAVTVAKIPM